MKLFHYSKEPLKSIEPMPIDVTPGRLIAQTVMGDARRPPLNENGHWGGATVFFHDRLPMMLLDAIFSDTNPYWPKGVTIYEHEIETNLLSDLYYYVLDPTELVDFEPGLPGTGTSYPEKWLDVLTRNTYLGVSVPQLNEAIARLKSEGSMEERFRTLHRRTDFPTLSRRITMGLPVIYLRTRPIGILPTLITPVSH